MSIEKFINALESGNTAEAKTEFSGELRSRVADAVEARRADVGAAMGPVSDDFDEDL